MFVENTKGMDAAWRSVFWGLPLLLLMTGCTGIGAARIEGDRGNYNQAIQQTNDEQLLLNLVRLKYRDTPFFMEVSNVASQFIFSAGADASSGITEGGAGRILGLVHTLQTQQKQPVDLPSRVIQQSDGLERDGRQDPFYKLVSL